MAIIHTCYVDSKETPCMISDTKNSTELCLELAKQLNQIYAQAKAEGPGAQLPSAYVANWSDGDPNGWYGFTLTYVFDTWVVIGTMCGGAHDVFAAPAETFFEDLDNIAVPDLKSYLSRQGDIDPCDLVIDELV